MNPQAAASVTVRVPPRRGALLGTLSRSIRPRPARTVSAWADAHRVLSSKGSGEPGTWRTARTPYLREIMDQLSVGSPTQRIVLKFGAQIGKTEAALNWLGYIIEHAPAPTLVVLPTIEVRKRWVMQRLHPMIAETPRLRGLINDKSRESANSADIKDFPGGFLVLGGANSAASLASMSAPRPSRAARCCWSARRPSRAPRASTRNMRRATSANSASLARTATSLRRSSGAARMAAMGWSTANSPTWCTTPASTADP